MIYFKTKALLLICLCASSLFIQGTAQAGQACSDKPLSIESLRLGTNTAINVQRALDSSKAQVALVARVGMDLSEHNIRYTHAGLVYRDKPSEPWRIAHLLNACGSAVSDLWHEGLGNFFMDDLHSHEAILMLPPNADVEQRLLKALTSTVAMRSVHNPAYSMVAYPFSLKYQNSNDWVLETLAIALSTDAQITNRTQAQAWLKLAGYEPSEMRITAGKRLGARMFKANVAFDDHPNELRFADRIQTVTVDSLVNFLEKRPAKWKKQIVAQSAAAPTAAATTARSTTTSSHQLLWKEGGFSVHTDGPAEKPQAHKKSQATQEDIAATAPGNVKLIRPQIAYTSIAPYVAPPKPAGTKRLMGNDFDLDKGGKHYALSQFALLCMEAYPETRVAILKRYRKDIEALPAKEFVDAVLNQDFEEMLKLTLSSNEAKTGGFSPPAYVGCEKYSPATIFTDEKDQKKLEVSANEQMHYSWEIWEQCRSRYPNRKLGAALDVLKNIELAYGPSAAPSEFDDRYRYEQWLKSSVPDSDGMQKRVADRVKQHGESGWQARCKPS